MAEDRVARGRRRTAPERTSRKSAERRRPRPPAGSGQRPPTRARPPSGSCSPPWRRRGDGDFSVRLPERRAGLIGQIGAAFNDLADTHARMTKELVRVSRVIGREGRMTERVTLPSATGDWAREVERRQRPDRRPRPPHHRGRPRHRRGRRGRPHPEDGAQDRGPAGQGRVPAHRHDRELDGRPALARSPPRSPASPARSAPTASSAARPKVKGVSGTLEGPHRHVNFMASNLTDQVRNIAAGDDRRRQRRPDAEDHGRREGRGARAEEHRSTRWSTSSRSFADEVTRVAREVGTDGKLGGQAEVKGVVRHLEGPHRQRELHRLRTSRPRCATSPRSTTAVAEGRPVAEDHGRGARARCSARDTINTMVDQLHVLRRRGHARRARGRHRRQARRPGRGQGRVRHLEGPHRQRELHGRQPHEPGAQHRRT